MQKDSMRNLLLFVLAFMLGSSSVAEETEKWCNRLSSHMIGVKKEEVPGADFFEVAASKLGTAVYWLSKDQFIDQSIDDVEFFGQHNFSCPSPKKLYLIRAVYENGGTGGYTLEKFGQRLLVSHMSLGGASGLHRSAIVACLDFEPQEVFHAVGGVI